MSYLICQSSKEYMRLRYRVLSYLDVLRLYDDIDEPWVI